MYTDTADGLSVSATVPVMVGFGWTTFVAMELKQISKTVNTARGAYMTAHTMTMSPSFVLQVLLQTVYSSYALLSSI